MQIELIQQYCDRPSVYRELAERRVRASTSSARSRPTTTAKKAYYEALGYELVSARCCVRGQHVGFVDTLADFGFFTELAEDVPGFVDGLTRHRAHLRRVGRHRPGPHPHQGRLPHSLGTSRLGLELAPHGVRAVGSRGVERDRRIRCMNPDQVDDPLEQLEVLGWLADAAAHDDAVGPLAGERVDDLVLGLGIVGSDEAYAVS